MNVSHKELFQFAEFLKANYEFYDSREDGTVYQDLATGDRVNETFIVRRWLMEF